MMPVQRTRQGESRVRNKSSNGPRRVQSNARESRRVFCNVRHTSVAGDMQVSRKAHGASRESRWHRG